MYLRKSFQRLEKSTQTTALDNFRSEYGDEPGVIDIVVDSSSSGDNTIYVLVNRDNVSVPRSWGSRKVVKFNIRAAQKECGKLLQRIEDEKIDVSDPQNQYFLKLIVEGKSVCDKLTRKPKTK
jgi:hypothetical protein